MNRVISGLFAGAAAIAITAAGCKEDPTAGQSADATGILTNASTMVVSEGDSATLRASVINSQGFPLEIPVSFAECDAKIDTFQDPNFDPPVSNAFQIYVKGLTIGASCVTVSGGGFTETVDALVAPIIFPGAVSDLAPAGGSTIIIASTTLLKFAKDPQVIFGGSVSGGVASATADQITVVVPFSSPGPLLVQDIAPSYIQTNTYALNTVDEVTQTGDFWVGDGSSATAPTITVPTSVGNSLPMITNLFGSDNAASCPDAGVANNTPEAVAALGGFNTFEGPCMFYKFTLAAPAKLAFILDWDGAPPDLTDLDIFACSAAQIGTSACGTSPESGTGGKTENDPNFELPGHTTPFFQRPEGFSFTFPAGDHYLVIERRQTFNPTGTNPPPNLRVTILNRL